MPTSLEREQKLEDVNSALGELAEIDPNSLARTDELSPTINFEAAVPHFEGVLDVIRQLRNRDLSRLPSQQLIAISQALQTVTSLVEEVTGFDLNQNTPGDVCRGIITKVENSYDAVMQPLLLPLAFTATQATDYARIEREAKGYLTNLKTEADELQEFLKTTKTKAGSALQAVQKQAAEAGVSETAQFFRLDSESHAARASTWLKTTIAMSATTFLAAVGAVIVAVAYTPESTQEAFQYVVAKLIIFSVLSFGILWAARNYRAEKHNETLNRHRSNALLTFQTFVEGTEDPRVSDAILLQAAQSAFGGRATGFESGEQPEPMSIHPVVEVLGRGLPPKGGDS